MSAPAVSVCVCTYRRPEQLRDLIARLAEQRTPPSIAELIVVDNDAGESARAVVETAQAPFPLRYQVEPQKNIAAARNCGVGRSSAEWTGFLDDDETPGVDWLLQMHATATRYQAQGVLGPVISEVPEGAPGWLRQGQFFARARHPSGTVVPRNELRIGNALIRTDWLRRLQGPFDLAYGRTGGEDGNMLLRLVGEGAKLVWCDEAVVTEPIPAARLNLRWILRRAYRGGQDFARHTFAGGYGPVGAGTAPRFTARALAGLAVSVPAAVATLPLGRRRYAHWLQRTWAHAGKLSIVAGLGHYEEYR